MEISSVSGSTAVNRPTASPASEPASPSDPASPEKTEKKTAAGGYISPFLRYDQSARVAVLLFRDIDSGETRDQIPSRRVVEEYRRAASRLLQANAEQDNGSQTNGNQAGDGRNGVSATAGSSSRGVSFASFHTSATLSGPGR